MSRSTFLRRALPASLLGAALCMPSPAAAFPPPQPRVILSLDTLAGPTSGGTAVRLEGFWDDALVKQVTFDGVPAPFTLTDGQLTATTPPHAAAENVPVTVELTSPDGVPLAPHTYVGFDYEGPKPAGSVERTISYTCEPLSGRQPAVIRVRVQLRAPQRVLPGEALSISEWKSTVSFDRTAISRLNLIARAVAPRLRVTGTTSSELVPPADFESGGTLWTPIAFDTPRTGFVPEQSAGTVTAPLGGAVRIEAPSFTFVSEVPMNFDLRQTLTCTAADSLVTTIPVTDAPVLPAPVVERVAGSAFANFGGVLLVSGTNLKAATSVTVGRATARIVARYGGGLFVIAPRLPAGRYPVTVTTRTGTSAASDRATVVYRSLF